MFLIEQNLVQFFSILRVQFMEHEELFKYKKVNIELHSNDNIIIEQVALRDCYRKQYCKKMVLACAWCVLRNQ